MSLPGGDRAEIDRRKVTEYLLSPSHPVRRWKAAAFSRFGYSINTPEALELDLRQIAVSGLVEETVTTEFGTNGTRPQGRRCRRSCARLDRRRRVRGRVRLGGRHLSRCSRTGSV